MSIIIKKVVDNVFGNLVHVSNGEIEFAATLDFGPRIIHLSMVGKQNMLFQDLEKKPLLDDKYEPYGTEQGKLYGGHRLWVSPELFPSTYNPDNFPVDCKEIENGVVLTAPTELGTLIQKSIEIKFCCGKIKITHSIKNNGAFDVKFAPWSLTVMAAGGVEFIPQPKRQERFLGNRVLGLWPYTKMNDPRVYFGENYISLKQCADLQFPFKIGINNEEGWAAYFNFGQLFIKRYVHNLNGVYPDFGLCSYQTYTNSQMLEMETLGEYKTVAPAETVTHQEEWELYNETTVPEAKNEAEIAEVLAKYVK